jgi:hypothetical protein
LPIPRQAWIIPASFSWIKPIDNPTLRRKGRPELARASRPPILLARNLTVEPAPAQGLDRLRLNTDPCRIPGSQALR